MVCGGRIPISCIVWVYVVVSGFCPDVEEGLVYNRVGRHPEIKIEGGA